MRQTKKNNGGRGFNIFRQFNHPWWMVWSVMGLRICGHLGFVRERERERESLIYFLDSDDKSSENYVGLEI